MPGNDQSEAVTFTPADTTDYATATASGTVNVSQATPMVSVNPVNITYGTALDNSQLSGMATWVVNGTTVNVAGTITYASDDALLGAGDDQFEVVFFTPADTIDYSLVTTGVIVNVAEATPNVGVNPVNITYGTALDDSQPSGTATVLVSGTPVTVPGTFSFASLVGTVLSAGSGQTETVTFTPTDTTDYQSINCP